VAIGNYDDDIAHLHLARRGAIEADLARTTLTDDGVSLEPLAVIDVDDLHLFPLVQSRRV
jgi:hypothetical protein